MPEVDRAALVMGVRRLVAVAVSEIQPPPKIDDPGGT
jgi:hypothetical protein